MDGFEGEAGFQEISNSEFKSNSTVFDASQYAFFGNDVVEEIELGGLEDEDEDLTAVGFDNGVYQLDREEGGVLGSLSEVDDLATTFSKVLLNGHNWMIFPTGTISMPWKVLKKANDCRHSNTLPLLIPGNRIYCTEHRHILKSSSNIFTNTSLVNQFLLQNHLSLYLLPLVADLNNLRPTITHTILIFPILQVGTNCCHLHPLTLPSLILSFSWLHYPMVHNLAKICLNLLLLVSLLIVERQTNGSTIRAYTLEIFPATQKICCNNSYLIKMV